MILYWLFSSYMFPFVFFLFLIYLFFSNRSLSSRLRVLENKLKNDGVINEARVELTQVPTSTLDQMLKATPVVSTGNNLFEKEEPNRFTIWLKEDWLMKLGAFLFIVGFGWFVSYAFANNWIGPIGRISIGILAGVAIMVFGFWRMVKYPAQGAVFMGLGAGIAMLTIFAGRSIYGFFTPASAVLIDFIFVAFISFASYKFNIKSLALIAQVLAFVTPLLTAGNTDSAFLFSYLLFISLATLFLASVTGWRDLITASLIFVGMYSIPYITAGNIFGGGKYESDAPLILNFAYVFGALYLLSGMFAVFKKGVENKKNEIVLAVLNGLFLFLWIYNVAPAEWSVMIFAFWAIIFTLISFAAFYFTGALAPFYAYGSVAVAFIGAATAAQLDGASLTIAFIVEVFLLVVSVSVLTKDIKAMMNTSWLFAIPLLLSFGSISKYSYSKELFTADFFVLLLMALTLVFTGRLITGALKQSGSKDELMENSGSGLVVFGTLYGGYILWQFMHILISSDPDMATMVSLIIYTIFGLVAYFAGLYGNDKARHTYGIALLSFVVIRLILIDVWQMELFGRVVTFLAIGILLMSTAFLTKKKKHEN